MANGNFAGGNGTEFNPFLIEDVHDLNAVRNNLSAYYKLVNDIDLNVSPYNEGQGWNPIGNTTTKFDGFFDGNGKIIKNLMIRRSGGSQQGLFGYVNKSALKNFGVIDINIVGNSAVGGIVGNVAESVLQNVFASGQISGFSAIGGLVGSLSNTILRNSYSTVNVKGTSSVGGLVGTRSTTSSIWKCYSIGKVEGTSNVGGSIGNGTTGDIKYIFWNTETSGMSISSGGVGRTTAQMLQMSTYVTWDNELLENGAHIWILKDGEYPKLWFEINSSNKYIIKSNNKFYNVQAEELKELDLIEPLTKSDFQQYGMSNISRYTLLDTLENPKLLVYSEAPDPTVNIKAIPKGQLIKPVGDIFLKMLDRINSITLHSNKVQSGVVKIIFSVDGGATWKTYNSLNLEFEDINISNLENIKSNGMDADVFNAIGTKWNEVITESKIRFAYYLEIDSLEDISEVDKLGLNMDIQGRLRKAKHGVDYDYEYDNEHIYVKFLTDGSYKVNYTI